MPHNTLAAITFGSFLLVMATDQLPTLNIGPTCAGADLSGTARSGRCEEVELDARNTLDVEWSNFPAADRHDCLALTHLGGYPSYVQVLTCLEIARDARRLRAE